jgi:RpiB/LacA/LacB family sugar-phosphate isomerase
VRIAIASDKEGREIEQRLTAMLTSNGHEVQYQSEGSSDSADYAERVALAVLRHEAERGIILTNRGVGASVVANRVPGVRAALCGDAHSAHLGAKDEGMNVLVLALHSLNEGQMEEIVNAYLNATLASVDVVGGLPPRRLQSVFAHVRNNISRELAVEELANVVGMSQYYFSKLFKTSTGITPHQYVMRQRVERAQEHLRDSRTPLSEIASQVGFETQSHFTSVFRKLAGVTPKHYRDMFRKGERRRESPDDPAQSKSATAA